MLSKIRMTDFIWIISAFFVMSLPQAHSMYTDEQIEEHLSTCGARLVHTFKPSDINTLVVGCNVHQHEVHFLGGLYANDNGYEGELPLYSRDISSGVRVADIEVSMQVNDMSLEVSYECLNRKSGGRTTGSKMDLIRALSSSEYGRIRPDCRLHLWESNPTETVYISKSDYAKVVLNHIEGDLEKMSSLPFLPGLSRIIVEYYSERGESNYRKIIKNAFNLLQSGGILLLEVWSGEKTGLSSLKAEREGLREQITHLFDCYSNEFQVRRLLGEEEIPGRGFAYNNPIVGFSAVKYSPPVSEDPKQ